MQCSPRTRETLLYVGIVIWQMMRQSSGDLRQVGQEVLDAAEEANLAFLEQFAEEGNDDFDTAVRAITETYPEPEVLRYAVEAIMEEEEASGPPIRQEYRGLAFVHLKIVLDAMIASLEKPHIAH